MHDFTRLRVWQRAQKLALEIYKDTDGLDGGIHSALAAALRTSVEGISRHIEEGTKQPSPLLFARSLMQAITCASDLLSSLASARKLGIIHAPRHIMLETEILEIRRMLHALRQKILEWTRSKSPR